MNEAPGAGATPSEVGSAPVVDTMTGWILELPDQLARARVLAKETGWSPAAGETAVYLGGMGGSGLACQLARAILAPGLTRPCLILTDPEVPPWIDRSFLAGVVSYSGETWEAYEILKACAVRGTRLFAVSSRQKFLDDPRFGAQATFLVPAGYAPRAALGWMLVPVLLAVAGDDPRVEDELDEAIALLSEEMSRWRNGRSYADRDPQALARLIAGRAAYIYTAGESVRTVGARWKRALLENAKQMAHEGTFPELAHAEIMGWRFAQEEEDPVFVFLGEPTLERDRRGRGIEAAKAELIRSGGSIVQVPPRGRSRAARLLTQVALGDMVSVLVAHLRGVDPLPIEAIERVKADSERANAG